MKKNLIKIVKHYGIKKQLKYFQSEIYELNEAIIRYQEKERNPIDYILNTLDPIIAFVNHRKPIDKLESIKDEIADVMVMLKQIQYHYEINDEEIKDIMKFKIKRQLERIKEENKEVENGEKLYEKLESQENNC